MTRSSRASLGAALLLAGLSCLVAACGTRDDDGVGAGFIVDLGQLKAIRLLEIAGPDTSADYQLEEPAESPGNATTMAVGRGAGLRSFALLRFSSDLYPAAGTPIDSAFVSFKLVDFRGTGDSLAVSVHRIRRLWAESEDFRETGVPDTSAAIDTVRFAVETPGDTVRIALPASLYQLWTDQPDSNYGVALAPLPGETVMAEIEGNETVEPPVLEGWWNNGTSDTSVAFSSDHDSFAMSREPGAPSVAGLAGRVTVARGFPGRAYLRFGIPDRDSLPELWERSTVNHAELVLRLDSAQSAFNTVRLGAGLVFEPWQDTETALATTLYGIVDAVSDSLSADGEVVFEVTGLLQTLFDGTAPDYGLYVRAVDERPDADYLRFHGHDSPDSVKRPTLRIWYTPGDREGGAP
jgi:hypothetical protein